MPAEPTAACTDESSVPDYTLPPLSDGSPWPERRRALLAAFAQHVYGRTPTGGWQVTARRDRETTGLGGLARMVEIVATVSTARGARDLRILLHLPAAAVTPMPCVLGLNFAGNHTTTPDPWVTLTTAWIPDRKEDGSSSHTARHADRGMLARRWPMALALARGYAVATVYSGEIEPDRDGAWQDGLRGLFDPPEADDAWGCLGAWAFGLSRALDALIAVEPRIDARRVAVIGHSRLGKTALWAAAQDERFALTLSNDSGCTGAALSRRRFGERQVHLNHRFPHWCCRAYRAFDEREAELPIDQHQLIACLAPRPVLITSADMDQWADPRGEYLAAVAAAPAWGERLPDATPALNQRVGGRLGYAWRPGPHDITAVDWWHLLDHADQHMR